MKSPMTKFAVVAVIALACVIGALLWHSTGSVVTLADVLEAVEEVAGFTYRLQSTMTHQGNTTSSSSQVKVSNGNRHVKGTHLGAEFGPT